MSRYLRITALPFILLLAACQGSNDVQVEPAQLVPLQASIQVQQSWKANLGKGGDGLLYGLAPAGNGSSVFAASSDGTVIAFDAQNGTQKWKTRVAGSQLLTAGPGVGGSLVVVGGNEGEVIALSSSTGEEQWRTRASSSILATPAVGGALIAVRTEDGQLTGLDASNGSELWRVDRRVQGLTLRGTSTPVISSNAVLTGFDNGKIAAIAADDGAVLWERSITERRGRNEFERLADVDGQIALKDNSAFTVGFQGRAMHFILPEGRAVWAQDLSSHHGPAVDWTQVYISAANDEVLALDQANGTTKWRQNQLSHREISAPAVVGSSVVVGDLEGFLHWISAIDGGFQARTRAGKAAIKAKPLAMGDMLFVQNEAGELYAFKKPAITATP